MVGQHGPPVFYSRGSRNCRSHREMASACRDPIVLVRNIVSEFFL